MNITPPPNSITQHQFIDLVNLPNFVYLNKLLDQHHDAPKPIRIGSRGQSIYYDADEVNDFIERHKITRFSNGLAQQFIRRPGKNAIAFMAKRIRERRYGQSRIYPRQQN